MTLPPMPVALQLQGLPEVPIAEYLSLPRLFAVLVILGVTWLVIRYLSKLLDFFGSRSPRARFVVRWVQPTMRIALWFGALLLSVKTMAPNQETFWAGLASLGLAFGLGAQDLVKNLFGGLIIVGDRPFQLGDRVKVGDAYGEIDHIGLHSSKLTTSDDTRVTIPNAHVASSAVFNTNSGVPEAQVVTDVYLPPATDPDQALHIGYDAAHTSPYLLPTKPVVVLVSDLFDQQPYLRLRIKAYVFDHRFEPRMQSDITARAKAEFLRLGMLNAWLPGPPPSNNVHAKIEQADPHRAGD